MDITEGVNFADDSLRAVLYLWIKKGYPRIELFGPGIFFCFSEDVMKYRDMFRYLFLWLLMSSPGFSEEAGIRKDPVMLDAVVVTADKADSDFKTGDVETQTTPAFFSVITRENFEGKTENLAEVIEKEAGVQVRQSGGLGSFSSVSLRGSSSDQVMVFLDGILLNDASGGGVDLSSIALADVEAIEIYRGVTPINFSKASVGGAVNIRTLRSKDGFSASASAGYGSFNTQKLNGLMNHKAGKWDYLLSADYLASDNDFDILNDNGTRWNPLDDRWEERNNAQIDQHNLLAKAGYDVTEKIRLDLVNQWFDKSQGLPAWNNSPSADAALDTRRNITTLNLTADNLSPLHLNTSTQISYTWKEEEYDDRGGYIGMEKQYSTYTTTHYGADFFLEWMSDQNTVIFSAGFLGENYETEDHLNKHNPRDSNRDTWTLGIQDSLFVFADRLIITPGFRYTWINDELESGMSYLGTPLDGRSRDDSYFCPQIGAKYLPMDGLAFKSNLAKYVREPSFFELFGDRGFFMGNPDLKKEEGINFDAGTEISWQTGNKWFPRMSLNAAYFRNDTDDLISRVYDARGIGRSVNISSSLIQGAEAGASLEIHDYFRVILNATWQDPENQSSIKAFNGKNLPGRSETSYLARLEAFYKGFKIYGEYVKEEDMYYDTANLLKAEDKEEINAGLSWLYRSLLISLEARNLGDDLYEDFNGYPMPGRSFYAAVKYEW
jgi:iron complex outermembrane receptor protein